MTELGHGSNVAALQTECVLDTTTDEWIVNTPDDSAIKWCAIPTFCDSPGHCVSTSARNCFEIELLRG